MTILSKCPLLFMNYSFQLTVEMFDYMECELNLFLTGELQGSGLTLPDAQQRSSVVSLSVHAV